jgi:hypothetical protein
MSFFATGIPITGWSSNITMADRALEEYGSTSGTWDADSSTTVLGPQGTQIGGALTSARAKTITWATTIQPTDKFVVELSEDRISWFDQDGFANTAGTFYSHNTMSSAGTFATTGGVYVSKAAAANQTLLTFCRYAATENDDSAVINWSSSIYWRVRKVSGGAQVGYPISSANIYGRTDGNAPATGMVGERISATGGGIVNGSMPAINVPANVVTLSLPSAGTYQVFGCVGLATTATSVNSTEPYLSAALSTTSATLNAANNTAITITIGTVTILRSCSVSDTFTVSGATTMYLVAQHGLTTIGGAYYGAIGTNVGTRLYAIRIA